MRRLLGIVRIQRARLRTTGAEIAAVYGCAGTFTPCPLAKGMTDPSQRDLNQKKNNINYHLSRMYPKIKGPHKRD